MGGIFHDADVGDVALAELAIGVGLAEAGLDDAPLLVLEALGAGDTSGTWTLGGLLRRVQAGGRVHAAAGSGHELRVGAIAHVAVPVRRRARHGADGVLGVCDASCGRIM